MSDVHLERETSDGASLSKLAGLHLSEANTTDRGLVTQDDAPDGDTPQSTKTANRSAHVWYIIAGGVVAFFWISGVLAFTLGQSGLSGLMGLPVTSMASLGFVAFGPAIFVLLAAFLIAELVRFRSTAQYIGSMAARFADPAKATREDARLMTTAVHVEITKVNNAVEGALARLGAMEEVLGHHSEAFTAAESSARERTDVLINDLRREREAVADLAIVLDQKAADIANAITEQSKMVVAAADIANAHAIDSTKSLEQSANRLTSSAYDATQGAKVIAEKLDDASGRLSSSTIALGDVSKALNTTTDELDKVHERARASFAASKDDAQTLTDMTRQSVEQMQDVAKQGAETIGAAFESSLSTAHANVQDVQRETRMATERNARQSEELRNAAEEARSALDAYAEVIAKRLEQANEASFSAASWADKTFERLDAATKTLEDKLSALPETADAQARDLQHKLRMGLEGLNEAARAAADEAEEIDAGFQARIRQNYELLSDFMLRMGSAADQRSGAMDIPSPFAAPVHSAKPVNTSPAPVPTPAPSTTQNTVTNTAEAPAPKKKSFIEAQIEAQNEARSKAQDQDTTQDEKNDTSSEPQGKETQGWSWKDVLSGMDRGREKPAAQTATPAPKQGAPDVLDRLVTLFRIHNIDPKGLFDTQVYRSLSHARLVGGERAMLDIIKMEAAPEINALGQAFADDNTLQSIAEDFVTELRQKIDSAAAKGNKVHLETHLRTGDGPAFLLIETALDSLR